MSKKVAFIALAVLAIAFAVLGRHLELGFLSDLWSQLFWLAIGTLATTFVLEAILQRAARLRQRSGDAFVFRTFSANMMNALHEIVGLGGIGEKLFESALAGDKEFEVATADVASQIEQSDRFEPGIYLRYYIDVPSGLRDLSKNYIRLFSANRKDMVAQYRDLNKLANLWDYKDELSEGFREYTNSLRTDDPERLAREASLRRQVSSARGLAVNTAKHIAKLAAKSATGKGAYNDD